MPAGPWPGPELLQHEHRTPGRQLVEKRVVPGREQIRQPAARARSGNELDLKAAAPRGQVDLGNELVGCHVDGVGGEHGRKRRRPALVFALRKERRRLELDAGGIGLAERFLPGSGGHAAGQPQPADRARGVRANFTDPVPGAGAPQA